MEGMRRELEVLDEDRRAKELGERVLRDGMCRILLRHRVSSGEG